MGDLVKLKKLGAGTYATLDGRYQIERQDGITGCEHPLCDTLHERFPKDDDGMHWTTYVAWHIWDTEIDDYAGHQNDEFETKREAHRALSAHLNKEQA